MSKSLHMVEITHWVWVWAAASAEAERLAAGEADLGIYDADPEIIVHEADPDPDEDELDTVPIGGRGTTIRALIAATEAAPGGPAADEARPAPVAAPALAPPPAPAPVRVPVPVLAPGPGGALTSETTGAELEALLAGLGGAGGAWPCRAFTIDLEIRIGVEWERCAVSTTTDETGDHRLVQVYIALDIETDDLDLIEGLGRTLGEALDAAVAERRAVRAERRL